MKGMTLHIYMIAMIIVLVKKSIIMTKCMKTSLELKMSPTPTLNMTLMETGLPVLEMEKSNPVI